MFIDWHSTIRKTFPFFIYFFTYLFILDGLTDSYCIQYIMIHFIIILIHKWSHIWPVEFPSRWLLCPFEISSLCLEHFLAFWCTSIFLFILYFPAPARELAFMQRFVLSFSREWYLETKIWALVEKVTFNLEEIRIESYR